MSVKNKQTTFLGGKNGVEFDLFGMGDERAFIFDQGNSIVEVSWPKNYEGQYKNSLDEIVGNIKPLETVVGLGEYCGGRTNNVCRDGLRCSEPQAAAADAPGKCIQ